MKKKRRKREREKEKNAKIGIYIKEPTSSTSNRDLSKTPYYPLGRRGGIKQHEVENIHEAGIKKRKRKKREKGQRCRSKEHPLSVLPSSSFLP